MGAVGNGFRFAVVCWFVSPVIASVEKPRVVERRDAKSLYPVICLSRDLLPTCPLESHVGPHGLGGMRPAECSGEFSVLVCTGSARQEKDCS